MALRTRRLAWLPIACLGTLAAILWAGIGLASEVGEGETLEADRAVVLALRNANDPMDPLGPVWFEEAMRDLTALGSPLVLALVVLGAGGVLALARRWSTLALLLIAVAGGELMVVVLKGFFDRPRPDLIVPWARVTSSSFPSGHATSAAVIYLTLGAILARAADSTSTRLYLLAWAIALPLLVGGTRVYLGMHWPSDVLAGWSFGAAWALLCSLGAWMFARSRHH